MSIERKLLRSLLMARHGGDDDGDDGDDDDDAAMSGMNMSPSDSSSNTMGTGMSMSFHLGRGDPLWLSAFTPQSHGAMFGACLLLVLLGTLHRLLHAMDRGCNAYYWEPKTSDARRARLALDDGTRVGVPWLAKVDLPRGALEVLRSFLAYLLMLAVMTFNFWYFLSILAGLGLGEVAFGRFGRRSSLVDLGSADGDSVKGGNDKDGDGGDGDGDHHSGGQGRKREAKQTHAQDPAASVAGDGDQGEEGVNVLGKRQ